MTRQEYYNKKVKVIPPPICPSPVPPRPHALRNDLQKNFNGENTKDHIINYFDDQMLF